MDTLYPCCAGLDVHKATVVACDRTALAGGKARREVRTFGTMTADLLALADWLAGAGVTHVAMESTGVYWKPVFHLLEGRFAVLLVNAQHIKQVPGRKTDVKDCEWIAQLLQHGLLKASFIPPAPIRELRDLTRQRVQLVQERAAVANRVQKVLEDANVKLASVASDVLGESGRSMLRALIGGETDPERLADLARGRLRARLPELRQALHGRVTEHHRFLLRLHLDHLQDLEALVARVGERIEAAMTPFADAARRLATIPGVSRRTAEVLVAEVGADMGQFPTGGHLASWAGMCPGNDESAGKRRTGRTTRGSRWLRTALVQAAWAASRAKGTYLQSHFKRVSEQAEVEFGPGGEPVRVAGTVLDITDRVRAGQALRESEERLRTLSDNLPLGAVYQVLVEPEGRRRFLHVSAGVGRVFGVPPADALADAAALYGLVHEDDRDRVAAAEAAAARDNAPFDCEFRSHTRAGGLIWVHARSAPRRMAGGPVAWEGVVMDVTARRAAADALDRERELLGAIIDRIPVMLTVYDPDTRVLRLNSAFETATGWSARDAAGVSLMEECYPDPAVRGRAREFMESCRDGWLDIPLRTRDGRDLETSWANVRLTAGTQVGIGIDITDRKRAESLLRSQNDRLRLLSEAAGHLLSAEEPDAMVRGLFDRVKAHLGADLYFNFMVTEAGDALRLESCAGVPDEVARSIRRLEFGQAVCGAVALERRPRVATHVQQSDDPRVRLVRGLGVRAYACHPLVADGRLYGTLSFASRTRDEFAPGEVEFLQAVTHFVTMAYERVRLIQRLRDADRRKDEFLATLAHELRNPLAPIRNGLQMLRLAGADPATAGYALGVMERQLAQMVRLIDDLLDVSRITRGKLTLRREPVDLAAVVRAAVEAARPLVEAAAHRLAVALPADPVWLDADPARLAQVFANLLTNAAKYTDPGGAIRLAAARDGGEVVVSVADTGIGIAPEHLPRVFEMFGQVETALSRSQGGLGIGLSLVRGLVEMHGGTVEARSGGLGKGSEFVVRLPAADAPGGGQGRPDAPTAEAVRPARRVLVVDDNVDAAESLAMVLAAGGHEVRTAHDGEAGVAAAGDYRPDVVLMDIGMPRLNGYDAARRVRAEPWGRGVVLVALTGWGQEDDKRRAREAGFDHHLTKPVDPAALDELLARGG